MYCGAGTIGIYLAKNFNYVRGIEQNKDAIVSANKNKEINEISNIDFVCDEVCNIDKINEDGSLEIRSDRYQGEDVF